MNFLTFSLFWQKETLVLGLQFTSVETTTKSKSQLSRVLPSALPPNGQRPKLSICKKATGF